MNGATHVGGRPECPAQRHRWRHSLVGWNLAFQRAPNHRPPTWPDPAVPQQIHLDIMVDDVAAAAPRVLALGARRLAADVYADPAGHPFCLIPRPFWADPIN
jgi:Glyoxalase-like domain